MTTFTKLDEQETPVISVHPSRKISKVNPNIYAGFTEYDFSSVDSYDYNILTHPG